jgi:hypothetical protein
MINGNQQIYITPFLKKNTPCVTISACLGGGIFQKGGVQQCVLCVTPFWEKNTPCVTISACLGGGIFQKGGVQQCVLCIAPF